MSADSLNTIIIVAAPGDIYKILFYSLLGLILLSAFIWLTYKNALSITLFFSNMTSVIRKYISKAYLAILGRLTKPIAGFAYSKEQDIFYSTMNPWQRKFGYSRLYDEAAAYMAMIVDSEPVYFNYGGKRWLIELWKGQYGMTTGCEVGIYNTTRPSFNIPGINSETFYDCASDEDMLFISFILYKDGRILFSREGKHWWLTGFRLGEFSQPYELVMRVSLTLKDRAMRDAFLKGMRNTGYLPGEISVNGNTVSFVFDQPRSAQPYSRTPEIENFMQQYNKQNCEIFRELTKDYGSTPAKLAAIRKKNPSLYSNILSLAGPSRYGVLKK